MLLHVHHGERFTVVQRKGDGLDGDIALCAEEFGPGEGGAHLEACKARGTGGIFTSLKELAAHPLPRPVRVDEEGANLGGIALRVKQSILASGPMVAAVERFAFAPAAAADYAPRSARV